MKIKNERRQINIKIPSLFTFFIGSYENIGTYALDCTLLRNVFVRENLTTCSGKGSEFPNIGKLVVEICVLYHFI